MLSLQYIPSSSCASSLGLRKCSTCVNFSFISERVPSWSVWPSEQWKAAYVLADIVVWVSDWGLAWWITLLMILAWEWALFKKADIRRVSLSFIQCYGFVELCEEPLLQRPRSTLDYLMFLFYKPGLICRAKKQEIQSARLILRTSRFFVNKTCRLNGRRFHRNII